jgi:hypothetical protein
MLTEIKIIIRI